MKLKYLLIIACVFFAQSVYSQCPRCGKEHPQYSEEQQRRMAYEYHTYYKPAYSYTRGYWRCYCNAERMWYDTMNYPTYRTWRMWSALTR